MFSENGGDISGGHRSQLEKAYNQPVWDKLSIKMILVWVQSIENS